MRFRDHWTTVLGVLSLIPSALRLLRSGMDYAGYSDLIIGHIKDPGWVGTMFNYIVDPPSWLLAPTLIIGLSLIWWQSRKRPASHPATGSVSRHEPPRSLIQQAPSDLTNEQLKFRTSLHTSALGNLGSKLQINLFEGKMELKRAVEKLNRSVSPVETTKLEAEIMSIRADNDDRNKAHTAATFAQYNARFRHESLALRKELAKRTGIPMGGLADPSSILLDQGRDDDVAYITKAAKHLHDMADNLEI